MSDDGPVLAACFNEAYVPHVATMLRSFAEVSARPARWYLITDDSVAPDVLRQLLDFARGFGMEVESLQVPDLLVAGFQEGTSAKYPKIAWYRSVLAEALPGEDRVVYLDSDLIVLHDLQRLWETELGDGHFFGAVCHPSYGAANDECERLGLPPNAPLFNSGVMVMDLALMRSDGFARRTREFVVSPSRPALRYADQDAMNVQFANRWTSIDPQWNCINVIMFPALAGAAWADDVHHEALVLERAARSPAVVHFDGAVVLRPWHRRCFNPFADLYRHYRSLTPWPLTELQGRRRDALLSHIPTQVQAKFWYYRFQRARRPKVS